MSFLADNLAPLFVAIVASVMAWLFGGARGGWLVPVVPWFTFIMLEVIFCFPQRHHGESTYEARARVWKALRHDPLVWTSLGLFLLLLVPFLNCGLCTSCDAVKIAQGFDPAPPIPFIPFCVNRLDHLNVVLWFATVLPSVIAVRHCLTNAGRRLVLQLVVWNGVAVAALGLVQAAMAAPGPYWIPRIPGTTRAEPGDFFATFGYPNMAGDYFVLLFGIAVALWRDHYERFRANFQMKDISKSAPKRPRQFWRKHFYFIPTLVFFYSALQTLSRAAIILATTTAVVYFFHALVVYLSRLNKAHRLTVGVWSMIVFGFIIFFAVEFMPTDLQKEVDTLGTTEVLDRVTGRGQYHVKVATEVWKDHKLFGCGGWGYLHLCVPKMKELGISLKELQVVGGINVHNDYLQMLAEHGLVGFGAMVAIVLMLLWPIGVEWRRLVESLRFSRRQDLLPKPRQIFVLPAGAFCALVALLASFIHAFGDCPLRSLAVMDLFFVTLAALPGFLSTHGTPPVTTNH